MNRNPTRSLPRAARWLPLVVATACGDPAAARGPGPDDGGSTTAPGPVQPVSTSSDQDGGEPLGSAGEASLGDAMPPPSIPTVVTPVAAAGVGRSPSYRLRLSVSPSRALGPGASTLGSYGLHLSPDVAVR